MAGEGGESGVPDNCIKVCVRVRPLNPRERDEGCRPCVTFDEPTKQVVLTAVDKNTLLQLRGKAAVGYAFDKRYGQESISDNIYDDCVAQLVESCFKGYNATVLAYGQTGSGKTHTMSGGVGIHGKQEEGVTPRVIRHIFAIAEALRKKEKPGEKTEVSAYGLEIYNEDLLDLAAGAREAAGSGWDAGKGGSASLKLQERPVGKDGRVVPEVVGVTEQKVQNADELKAFYDRCMFNRSTSSTKLNDRSSRSHAIFTITIKRTIVEVLSELGADFKAKGCFTKVRTSEFESKLHLVDLAGSERVKRSGVTGKELKEATHINSGLLALGNVIVALAADSEGKRKSHVPYRDSKLTRLLQDSLGGNSLTVLISCISPSEGDFEETNNTLKYANRACSIKNQPLPNKFTQLEEDLLPSIPSMGAAGLGMLQLQSLLEDHERLREARERREKEKREKEEKRLAALRSMREEQIKTPGFQRLRSMQYDALRKQMASRGNIDPNQRIADDTLGSFGTPRARLAQSMDFAPGSLSSPTKGSSRPSTSRLQSARKTTNTLHMSHAKPSSSQRFDDWMAAQEAANQAISEGDNDFFQTSSQGRGTESSTGSRGDLVDFIMEDDEVNIGDNELEDHIIDDSANVLPTTDSFIQDDPPSALVTAASEPSEPSAVASVSPPTDEQPSSPAAASANTASKSKFRRGKKADGDDAVVLATAEETTAPESDADVAPVSEADEPAPQPAQEEAGRKGSVYIKDNEAPRLLARFKVNQSDTLAVFKATTKEDFKDVIGLLPENTPLPASDKMTYLLARLEVHPGRDLLPNLLRCAAGEMTMNEAVGPAVGCLMATFGTNMIASCIFDFQDPPDLRFYTVEERIELWGLQIPHNSVRPSLQSNVDGEDSGTAPASPLLSKDKDEAPDVITWSSIDRLQMSIGLLYALCNHASENSIRCGFCVPRPQLLKRWVQAGVKMNPIKTELKLIYPPSAHDYEYYKASTVAWFMVNEVKQKLEEVLSIVKGT